MRRVRRHLGHSFWRNNWGMNNLSQLSDEAGAESYGFEIVPVVFFNPYFDDISNRLAHQHLLTFLAKPEQKAGLQSVRVTAELPNVELVTAYRVYGFHSKRVWPLRRLGNYCDKECRTLTFEDTLLAALNLHPQQSVCRGQVWVADAQAAPDRWIEIWGIY
jgi:hypothetical protein